MDVTLCTFHRHNPNGLSEIFSHVRVHSPDLSYIQRLARIGIQTTPENAGRTRNRNTNTSSSKSPSSIIQFSALSPRSGHTLARLFLSFQSRDKSNWHADHRAMSTTSPKHDANRPVNGVPVRSAVLLFSLLRSWPSWTGSR